MKKILIVLLFAYSLLNAAIINVPADYPTIQQGINESVNGDTVLVQPGTYPENINFEGKAITLGSLFHTTQDTSYISQTIIDGNYHTSVVKFDSGEDSSSVLTGFTITNGYATNGGGVYCWESSPIIQNVVIKNNSTLGYTTGGGGIYCSDSNLTLKNVIITNNSADTTIGYASGGGIYFSQSNPNLFNVMISNNSSNYGGGGMFCISSNPSLVNVTISNNSAIMGGGILFGPTCNPLFSSEDRCNIYLNYVNNRGSGSDIYSYASINVIVDTFTVSNPTDFHASPIENFTFDILHGIQDQINSDLFVSPEGNNNNSGLTVDEPLKTIQYACSIIFADSLNPHTIFLSEGTYSSSETEEYFPINIPDNVSLIGENEDNVILDAEGFAGVINLSSVENVTISYLTIINGSAYSGGGIYLRFSNPILENITIMNNSAVNGPFAYDGGGGIYCKDSNPTMSSITMTNNYGSRGGGISFRNSSPSLSNIMLSNNSASYGGGIYCENSDMILENITITNNSVYSKGGGIYCIDSSPSLDNVVITYNSTREYGGGIYCENSNPTVNNIIIANNSAQTGGGIYCGESNPIFNNVTIDNNSVNSRGGGIFCGSSNPSLLNVVITNNTSLGETGNQIGGGGIYCINSEPYLENVSIFNNSAYQGGGIYISNDSNPVFSSANRCNIYLNNVNNRGNGSDIYSSVSINVIVDTFTVSNPTDFHATPIENFTFDILHGIQDQVYSDLFVSPQGDNNNSGLTLEDPLKTIQYACSIIFADSLNPHTIFLS
ncbi:MAG: DUF1565 domain-containing protein, partial [Candidatus Cloacimonetes bacterium]|nr:DUF1565 domain-containing protein [Candidatus Cloacimonadota bacterium]